MSLINRYKFVKKMYPEVLCLYQEKQKITSCEQDLDIFIYLQKDLKTIKKKRISYILFDNLEIIEQETFSNNQYDYYQKLTHLHKLLNILKWQLINRVNNHQ